MNGWKAALASLALAGPAAAQPLTPAEARRILETPLSELVGPREAERVQDLAVLSGLLLHCRAPWQDLFDALAAQHRERLRRAEAEMRRVTVWHGFWQGQALRVAQREGLDCPPDRAASLRGQAQALLRRGPVR